MSNESKDSSINEEIESNATEQAEEAVTGELLDDAEVEESSVSGAVDEQIHLGTCRAAVHITHQDHVGILVHDLADIVNLSHAGTLAERQVQDQHDQ